MRKLRRSAVRVATVSVVLVLAFLLNGDRTLAQLPPGAGIDPLEVLDLQVKNNILFIVDNSYSMTLVPDSASLRVGGDDTQSRFYQAKRAMRQVLVANQGKANFGTFNFRPDNSLKKLGNTGQGGLSQTAPLTYVSQDLAAVTWLNFFAQTNVGFASYDGTSSADVYTSLATNNAQYGYGAGYPTGCVPGVSCRYYLSSRLFRNNVKFTWNPAGGIGGLVSTTAIIGGCPAPPLGLLGDDTADFNDGTETRPCLQIENSTNGEVATYYYSSGMFVGDTPFCAGLAVANQVAACSFDNVPTILGGEMRLEMPLDASGNPIGVSGPAAGAAATDPPHNLLPPSAGSQPNVAGAGLRTSANTPLGGSIQAAVTNYNSVVFPARPAAVTGIQKSFIILLTDGLETCGGNGPDQAAIAYNNPPVSDNRIETFVVAFTPAAGVTPPNNIARAGSGGVPSGGTDIAGGTNYTCTGGAPTCRDAFFATNINQLISSLNAAIVQALTTGEFSAAQPIISTVFELGGTPLDPRTRYDNRVNILYQSTFLLPQWAGKLSAYRNDGTFLPVPVGVNSLNLWEAGQTLNDKVSAFMATQDLGRGLNKFTFAELHAGADTINIRTSSALIKRRIYTAQRNGTFLRTTDNQFDGANSQSRNVVALWPPNQANLDNPGIQVDPPVGGAGFFDDELGLATLTYPQMQTQFKACTVTANVGTGPIPAGCDFIGNPLLATQTALKESRQIVLAFTAGAKLVLGSDNLPFRDITTSELLFRDRGWLLGVSTLATPAAVGPPLKATPLTHTEEWVLYRDGRRDNTGQGIDEIDKGFGMRNPDFDDTNPQTKLNLKPRMTQVFLAANDAMAHAFKGETSEEMWAYVPYDQLGKLTALLAGQSRQNHIYSLASSLRVGDIFIPGSFTLGSFTFQGRWRTALFFGRGAGGKYYTGLDITAPGPFTRDALDTNPPYVMWSRGNPDTEDGLLGGPVVRAADTAIYATMGYTWSVPAIGNPAGSPEWQIFSGSGYPTVAAEGSTFYALDAITGNVVQFADVGDGATNYVPDNALVANAAAYNAFLLDQPTQIPRSTDLVTRVFIPDVHGRIWKFSVASGMRLFRDLGPTQPFGHAVALLKNGSLGQVYAGSGGDSRVPANLSPPFRLYGFADTGGDTSPATLGTLLPGFPIDLPSPFRNAAQPFTAFNPQGQPRVFFAAVRFNPAGNTCFSSFDTLFFGLGANTGVAVYDFNGDSVVEPSTLLQGIKPTGLFGAAGQVIIGDSGALGRPAAPPPPPAPGMPPPAPTTPPYVVTTGLKASSAVCRLQ